jgi:N-acetylneuraminate lyase
LQEAQQLQFQVNRVVLALLPFGGIAATKAAMRFIGVDCGVPRAPLTSLSKEQQETLRAELEQAGFFRQ